LRKTPRKNMAAAIQRCLGLYELANDLHAVHVDGVEVVR